MRFRDRWTIDDLKTLIEAADSEHVDLEFKRCDALAQDDIKKTNAGINVSAFANATGGIVVFGVKELDSGEYEIDEGFDPNGKITKDWLANVLDTQIHPHIQGLTIFPIELDEEQKRYALLVQVPRSEVEPHQASDKRYYMRRDGKKVPMTHQEVKDAFFRAQYPNLQVKIQLTRCYISTGPSSTKLISDHNVEVMNVGRIMASYFLVKFSCTDPRVFAIKDRSAVPRVVYTPDCCSVISSTCRLQGVTDLTQIQLFPGQPLCLPTQRNRWSTRITCMEDDFGHSKVEKQAQPIDCDLSDRISWEIYADNAPSKSGSFALGDILPRGLLIPLQSHQKPEVDLRIDDVEPVCLG